MREGGFTLAAFCAHHRADTGNVCALLKKYFNAQRRAVCTKPYSQRSGTVQPRTSSGQRRVAPYRLSSVRPCLVSQRLRCLPAACSNMSKCVAMAGCAVLHGFIHDLVILVACLAGCALSSRPSFTEMSKK